MSKAPGPAQPKYQRIADQLRSEIREGRYPAGTQLPNEPALAKEYGVAVMTMRSALELLKNDGSVASRKGSGNYVQDLQRLRRHGVTRFAHDQWGGDAAVLITHETQTLTADDVSVMPKAQAPENIARGLGLSPEQRVFVRTCRFLLADRPVKLVRTYVPHQIAALSSLTRTYTGHEDIHAALVATGHAPIRFREEVCCEVPSGEESASLAIPPGRFVIRAYRTAFDADRRPVEVEEAIMDSASYVLDYTYEL